MINSDAFAERLKKVMSYYQLSSSAFADKIQVQRSSISHLLSGRNKPSLDFVMKVVQEFDEVELYWLLNGKGDFPPASGQSLTSKISGSGRELGNVDSQGQDFEVKASGAKKHIDRIVIFYDDGTFREYLP